MVEEIWTGGWSAVEISGLGKSLKRVKDGGGLTTFDTNLAPQQSHKVPHSDRFW